MMDTSFRKQCLLATYLLCAFCLCLAAPLAAQEEKAEFTLPKEDVELLESMFKDFLYDPKGAKPVSVQAEKLPNSKLRVYGFCHGWLEPATENVPAKLHLPDGETIESPNQAWMKDYDYVSTCKNTYKKSGHFPTIGGYPSTLVQAAWLYRLGEHQLAADALVYARTHSSRPETVESVRVNLAFQGYQGVLEAFVARNDKLALQRLERLLKTFPQETAANHPQALAIKKDLERLQKQPSAENSSPDQWPAEFNNWDATRKLAFLIPHLDEVKAQRTDPPSARFFNSMYRKTLLALGEEAVPPLIEVLEHDERLTRNLEESGGRKLAIISVREFAMETLSAILGISAFEPTSRGDSFSLRSPEDQQKTISYLRDYWQENRALVPEARMMRVLVDPQSPPGVARSAARTLAFSEYPAAPRPSFQNMLLIHLKKNRFNPELRKFQKPSVAEAIVAAMDRELATIKPLDPEVLAAPITDQRATENKRLAAEARDLVECSYIQSLIGLADRRVGNEAAHRYEQAKSPRMRRHWAMAAHLLGQEQPLKELAGEFEAGKLEAGKLAIAPASEPYLIEPQRYDFIELSCLVSNLSWIGTPEADRALFRLLQPDHPLHEIAKIRVLGNSSRFVSETEEDWRSHPYCIQLLLNLLDDVTPTGGTYSINNGRIRYSNQGDYYNGSLPDYLRSVPLRGNKIAERVCDQAANRLYRLILTVPADPPYHPLFKDADERLVALKKTIESEPAGYRLLSLREKFALGRQFLTVSIFVPNIQPLNHAATAEDVDHGRAIFSLNGKGTYAKLKLPASATVKAGSAPATGSEKVLIVQAEYDADQHLILGVIRKGGTGRMNEDELIDIVPIEAPTTTAK